MCQWGAALNQLSSFALELEMQATNSKELNTGEQPGRDWRRLIEVASQARLDFPVTEPECRDLGAALEALLMLYKVRSAGERCTWGCGQVALIRRGRSQSVWPSAAISCNLRSHSLMRADPLSRRTIAPAVCAPWPL